MILCSLVYGIATGKVDALSQSMVTVGEETLNFVLPLLAITCFFNGILEIAQAGGCLAFLERCLRPFLRFILPDIKDDTETLGYVASNIVINMFGLGSAATPVGLKAIKGMQKHNPDKEAARPVRRLRFWCLIHGGVTIFPTTIIALRAAYGSLDPTTFIPFAVVSTLFASFVGLVVDRWWNRA